MSIRSVLKAFFESGDIPTEDQYADLIDSNLNIDETENQSVVSKVEFQKDIKVLGSGGGPFTAGAIEIVGRIGGQGQTCGDLKFFNTDAAAEYIAAQISARNSPGIDHGQLEFYVYNGTAQLLAMTIDYLGNIWTVNSFSQKALSADPADPPVNQSTVWTSDGTESGEDGDYMIKVTNSLGVTLTKSLIGVVSLQLPEFIDMVSGDILQIYYSSMIAFPNWERFYFEANLDGGNDLKRYVEFDPSTTGNFELTIGMYDESNSLISEASTTIRVVDSVQQPASTVNYWNVGDSLTADPTYSDEMLRRLTGTGGTPAGDAYGNIVNHVEGNDGKNWAFYVSDEASPFVYSGVLDFEQYRIDNALAVPQALYILMTWNGMASDRTQAAWDLWDDDVYTFIDALRADFPSVEVKLMSPQFGSQNGGLGFDFGAGAGSDIFIANRNMLKQAEIYQRISGEASYSSWVEHINTALMFDSKYNMSSALKDVNTRNSSVQESIGSDGPHPATEGYLQIADIGYRNFILNYCQ